VNRTARVLVLAYAVLFVLLVIAAEVFLRWTGWVGRGTPYVIGSADYHYIQKAGASGRHVSPGEFDAEFHINSKGIRGAEIDYARNGSRRILALGDSFTFGFGVEDDQTWPAQLQRQLGVEVVNGGVMGWGLAEYLIWFQKEGVKYKPDLVVVGVHASDWVNAMNGLTSLDANGKIEVHQVPPDAQDKVRRMTRWIPFYDALMTHSALANVARNVVVKTLHRQTPAALEQQGDPSGDAASDVREDHNFALLRELQRQVRNAGGTLLLVFIPKYQALYPETDPDKVSHLFQKKLAQWASELDVPLLDMTPIYRDVVDRNGKSDPSYLFFLKDGHNNARGYRLIASTISDFLATHPDLLAMRQ
jgi:lysophospholipase L1-like esterase